MRSHTSTLPLSLHSASLIDTNASIYYKRTNEHDKIEFIIKSKYSNYPFVVQTNKEKRMSEYSKIANKHANQNEDASVTKNRESSYSIIAPHSPLPTGRNQTRLRPPLRYRCSQIGRAHV